MSWLSKTIDTKLYNPPKTNLNSIQNLLNNCNYSSESYFVANIHVLKISPLNYNNNKIMLYSHGNSSNISTLVNYLLDFVDKLNCTVIAYDYPGYGLSKLGNKPGAEQQIYDSLEKVVNDTICRYQTRDIMLVGRSLGTGIVIHFAAYHEWPNSIVLISPYKSIGNIIINYIHLQNNYLFMCDKFNSIDKIKCVTCPIKIYHGCRDELIGLDHPQELYRCTPNKKWKPTYLPNTGHLDILCKIDYTELRYILHNMC